MSKPSEWAVKAALELLIRWPWARSHLVRPCDTERAIALALDAARVEGVRLGLEAGNDECKRRAREEAQRAFERQGNDDAVFAHEQRQGALSDCGRSILALDPAAIAKGGTP